jgi:hypothetical protein
LNQNDKQEIFDKNVHLSHKLQQNEEMLKQYEKMLLSAQSLVKERDTQLESIRQRITIIAEVFEKKEIK